MSYRKRDKEILLNTIRFIESTFYKSLNLIKDFFKSFKFLSNNWKVLILFILIMASESLHLLFVNIPFNENVNLDSPIYYLVSQFGQLTLIPSIIIFLMISKENRASKGIAFGLILWNLKEMRDEICYIFKINNDVLIIDGGWVVQMSLLISIVLLSWFGFTKWKS